MFTGQCYGFSLKLLAMRNNWSTVYKKKDCVLTPSPSVHLTQHSHVVLKVVFVDGVALQY